MIVQKEAADSVVKELLGLALTCHVISMISRELKTSTFASDESFMNILQPNGNTFTKIIWNISFPLANTEIHLKDSTYHKQESGFTKTTRIVLLFQMNGSSLGEIVSLREYS